MPNAFDDLPQTSPEMEAISRVPGKNAFDDLEPPAVTTAKPADEGAGTIPHQLARGVGLSANALAHGVVGAINMIPDAATAAYDFARNPHVPSWQEINPFSSQAWPSNTPSAYADRALDSVLPTPQTTAEKVASVGLGMEGGALVPNLPVPGAKAPAEFVPPSQAQAQRLADSLEKAQGKGYVVPPSTTNPTLKNKVLESVAGKENTQNQARVINQRARNAGAAADIGLKPEVFTPGAVADVKAEAGQGFEAARSVPRFQTGQAFQDKLDTVLKETRGANTDFPGASNPDVEKLVETYRQTSFTGDSGVSAIKLLRAKASDAYRSGNSEMGIAYKGISNALEDELERGAQQAGGPYADLVSSLKQARRTYAKASTIEDVSDPQGNVSGQKLAAAWNRGEPLSDNLKAAAEHAANYPKANLPANSSNVSHLNIYAAPILAKEGFDAGHALAGTSGGLVGGALGASLPFARGGSRAYLLSAAGQRGARPSSPSALADALQKRFPNTAAGAVNSQ